MESLIIHKSNLSPEQVTLLVNLVEEYSDIFALDAMELGSTNLVTQSLDTGDSPPYINHSICQLVNNMMEQGVIQHSSSPWASPVALVKKNGSHRFVLTTDG